MCQTGYAEVSAGVPVERWWIRAPFEAAYNVSAVRYLGKPTMPRARIRERTRPTSPDLSVGGCGRVVWAGSRGFLVLTKSEGGQGRVE